MLQFIRILLMVLLAGGWLLGISRQQHQRQPPQQFTLPPAFEKAEYYYEISTEINNTDSLALVYYEKALAGLPVARDYAPYVFRCQHRIAALHQTYGNLPAALDYYYNAMRTHGNWRLPDSLLFQTFLFTGNIHYVNNHFDSALYYFERAEKILDAWPGQQDMDRLFNSMGAVYFESGNYTQSINYFNRALQLLNTQNEDYKYAVYSFNSNIASALRQLGYPDSALRIYKSLLPLNVNRGSLLLNMANVSLQMRQPADALQLLRSLPAGDQSVNPASVQVRLGQCHAMLGHAAAAQMYFGQALAGFAANSSAKSTETGLAWMEYGRLMEQMKMPDSALWCYQRAVIQYDYYFNDTALHANPVNFENEMKGYDLFEALSAKAACLASLSAAPGRSSLRPLAVNTYNAAFGLAAFIRKSFDNDEARLFISEKLFAVYEKAILFLLNWYRAAGDATLLQKAVVWMGMSKAATLAVHLKENEIKRFSGIPDSLLQMERSLRLGLSGLMTALHETPAGPAQERLKQDAANQRLLLSRLTSRLHNYPDYYRLKFAADSFSLPQLQQTMLNSRNAVLHYYKTGNRLHLVVIRHNRLQHYEMEAGSDFESRLRRLLAALENPQAGKKYTGSEDAVYLYQLLVQPALPLLNGAEALIIIPDGELIRLPFDALETAPGRFLTRQYSITYQYALPHLRPMPAGMAGNNVLAVAPFTKSGGPGPVGYMPLPSSAGEVPGRNLILLEHNLAVKDSFIKRLPGASVIHLATHAFVDRNNPLQSHIVFYPDGQGGNAHKLYVHELYNYNLTGARLVFLSACETGAGVLQRSEGTLSLARAFAYAGCPNIIMSLWKAEDHATAYISRRFYHHYQNGLPAAQALRQARLDLLNDADMSQFHSPAYWSHLVFIGNSDSKAPRSFGSMWWWLAVLITLLALYQWVRFVKRNRYHA